MNLEIITQQVADLSRSIGTYIKSQIDTVSNTDIEHKGLHDLVTYVDKESERRIVEKLRQILPQAGFIAEENQNLTKSENFNWIIDPLDGTTNFIHGIPVFSVSIALAERDELVAGVVYEVSRDECFYAWKNGGSFLNGNSIRVSKTSLFDDALLATGFPYYDYSSLAKYMGVLEEIIRKTRGVRRLGSAAVDLVYVACGRFDLFFEYGLNAWDVAAGALIVKESGGNVTNFLNEDGFLSGRQIVASNARLHHEFINIIQKYFID